MKLTITTFINRKNPRGELQTMTWEELKRKLKNPVYTLETLEEYRALTNEERTEIKDVGGFVGGVLTYGVRRKAALENRCVLTIDADDAKPGDAESFIAMNDWVVFIHTTHTSTQESPRLRYVFPLSRPVTAEEYAPVANTVASWIGVDSVDETTDQPERLMFWPSACLDADYEYWEHGDTLVDVDAILDEYEPIEPEPTHSTEDHIKDGALMVPEGHRNKTVFGFAANLRSNGLDYDGIRAMLEDYNQRYCNPPLPDHELDTITRSVCGRYAPGESVAASLREAWDDFKDLGEWKSDRKESKVTKLLAESMASLNARDVPPPKYIVPGIIPYGLTVLASPPKYGKSWMCMDLAISVSTGTQFLGLDVDRTDVVYLALEDGDWRLQDRGRKVGNGRVSPDNLFLVKEAPILNDGLIAQLDQLVEACENVGMIIIDTLQKVRGVAGRTEGVYGHDYRELGEMQRYAIKKGIAIVLVHHLNKGKDDADFINRLNGSTGVAGAADSIIVLDRATRGSDETKMQITGRDVEQRNLIIKMDWSKYRWLLLGEEKDVAKDRELIDFGNDPVVKTILWKLNEAEDLLKEEQDADQVEWQCSSQSFLDTCQSLYGEQPFENSTALGRRIVKLAPMLAEREGVEYEYKRVGKNRARTHCFSRIII